MDLWISSWYNLFATASIVDTFTCNALGCYFSLFSLSFFPFTFQFFDFLLGDGIHVGGVLITGRYEGTE